MGQDDCFTFDHTFDQDIQQSTLFEASVEELLDNAFNGYNATVMCYGQTGSGKSIYLTYHQ